jgi:hypothetical protein
VDWEKRQGTEAFSNLKYLFDCDTTRPGILCMSTVWQPFHRFRKSLTKCLLREDTNACKHSLSPSGSNPILTLTTRPHPRITLYEFMSRLVLPVCTALPHEPHPELPVSSVTTIIDLKDMPLTAMWAFRNHLQEASKLATANYPETLATIAVVNSPSFFPTVWGWIKV